MKAIAEYFRDLASEDRYFGAEPPTPDAQMLHQIAEKAIQKRVSAQVGDNSVTLRADTPDSDARPEERSQWTALNPMGSDAGTSDPALTAREALARETAEKSEAQAGTAQADSAKVDGADASKASASKLEDEIEDALAARRAKLGTTDSTPEVPAASTPQNYEEDEINAADPVNAPIVESVAGKLARIRALVAADRASALAAQSDAEAQPDMDATEQEIEAPQPASDFSAFEDFAQSDDQHDEIDADETAEVETAEVETELTLTDTQEAEALIETSGADDLSDSAPQESAVSDDAEEATATDAVQEDATQEDTAQEMDAWTSAEAEVEIGSDDAILAALGSIDTDQDNTETASVEDDAASDQDMPSDDELSDDWQSSDAADLSDVIGDAMAEDASEQPADQTADQTTLHAEDESFEDALAAALGDDAPEAEIEAETVAETEAEITTEVAIAETTAPAMEAPEDRADDEAITPKMSELVQMRRVRVLKVRRSVVEAAEAKALEAKALEVEAPAADKADDAQIRPMRAQSGRDRLAQIGIAHDGPAVERIIAATNDRLQEDDNRRRVNAISHLKAAVAATNAEREARGGAEPDSDDAADYRQDLHQVVRRPARTIRPTRPAMPQRDEDGQVSVAAPERERPAPLVLVSEQRIDAPSDHALELLQKRRILTGNSEPATQADLNDAQSFSEFADELGASELTDLLEAAAAYVSFVEGRPHFTRPHIMGHVAQAQADRGYSREDGLRSFGTLLRNGTIRKLKRGQFVIADDSKFAPEARYAGE